jgi:hypothetical protein
MGIIIGKTARTFLRRKGVLLGFVPARFQSAARQKIDSAGSMLFILE